MHFFLIFPFFITCLAGTVFSQNDSILINGELRTYVLHAPSGLSNPPLVISMHGASGTGSQQQSMSGFNKIADREKFVVVYPDGINKRWDVSGTKDLNFIMAIIDTMAVRFQIDRNRVYATGFSMGGMMSYTLACKAADKIAAIGPCSGYPMGGLGNCSPSRPMPILHVHGDSDTIVGFAGLASCISGWVGKNGCPQTAQTTKPYPESKPGSKVTKEYYGPCDQESEIIVLTVEGMGHAYPGSFGSQDISASEEYWAFFKNHSLNGVRAIAKDNRPSSQQSILARYAGGNIHLESGRSIRTVRMFDLQGNLLYSWKTAGNPSTVAVPVSRSSGGIYLVTVLDAAGQTALKVTIP